MRCNCKLHSNKTVLNSCVYLQANILRRAIFATDGERTCELQPGGVTRLCRFCSSAVSAVLVTHRTAAAAVFCSDICRCVQFLQCWWHTGCSCRRVLQSCHQAAPVRQYTDAAVALHCCSYGSVLSSVSWPPVRAFAKFHCVRSCWKRLIALLQLRIY